MERLASTARPAKKKRTESGTQLLARLGSRPSLAQLDSLIFGVLPKSKSPGRDNRQVIELYGPEGVGKSQLALHLTALASLPSQSKAVSLGGLGSKVIFIDTDFKFPVLGLAVMLEGLVLSALSKAKARQSTNTNQPLSECGDITAKDKDSTGLLVNLVKREISSPSIQHCESVTQQYGCNKTGNTLTDEITIKQELDDDPDDPRDASPTQDTEMSNLTTAEVDQLVQDSLSRIQMMRVSSSLQLLSTLQSLDSLLLCDTDISLVVIDSLSAFYWQERGNDPENTQCTEQKMKPIADTISKLSNEYGVTFLVTKAALIGNRRNRSEGVFNIGKAHGTSVNSIKVENNDICENQHEHVEFLGKSWLDVQPRRITLSCKLDEKQSPEFSAVCSSWSRERRFVIANDLVHFL